MGGNWGGTGSGKSQKKTRKEGLKKERGKKDAKGSFDILLVSTLVCFLSFKFICCCQRVKSFLDSAIVSVNHCFGWPPWFQMKNRFLCFVLFFVFLYLCYQEGEIGRLSQRTLTCVLWTVEHCWGLLGEGISLMGGCMTSATPLRTLLWGGCLPQVCVGGRSQNHPPHWGHRLTRGK